VYPAGQKAGDKLPDSDGYGAGQQEGTKSGATSTLTALPLPQTYVFARQSAGGVYCVVRGFVKTVGTGLVPTCVEMVAIVVIVEVGAKSAIVYASYAN
jgi:hypothetical protein